MSLDRPASVQPHADPRLLADIGGTYARFTLEHGAGVFAHAATLRCADHADFHAAVSAYLRRLPAGIQPRTRPSPSPTRSKATRCA